MKVNAKRTKKRLPADRRVSIDNLYSAVQQYVELNGGTLVVIGGLEIQQWPDDLPYTFRVAVRCTGKKPILEVRPPQPGGTR